MVEWNGIFRLFRFSGILGQPREVHPKFRDEIPENVCSIRSPARNFQNFWSNGKRPQTLREALKFFDCCVSVRRQIQPSYKKIIRPHYVFALFGFVEVKKFRDSGEISD